MGYAIAFSSEGATDVTRRYARSADRGNDRDRCPEPVLLYVMDEINMIRRANMSSDEKLRLQREDRREQHELSLFIISSLTAEFIAACGTRTVQGEVAKLTAGLTTQRQDDKLRAGAAGEGPFIVPAWATRDRP